MIVDEKLLTSQAGFVQWLRKLYKTSARPRRERSAFERRFAEKVRCYDPVLADKLIRSCDALDDLYAYVSQRFERAPAREKPTGQN